MLIPRYYQEEAVDAIFKYFKTKSGNPVVAAPTGTGKSLIIAEFVKRACNRYPQTKILVLTHVKELVKSNYKKLITQWPTAPAGIYSAGLSRKDTDRPITFAGVKSVINNMEPFGKIDLIIIDECHRVSPEKKSEYQKVIAHFLDQNPYLKVIGLSATPYRQGTGLILDDGLFTDFCYDCTGMNAFNRLIDEGYLAPLIPRRTETYLDATEVRTNSQDFVLKELQKAVDVDALTRGAVKEIISAAIQENRWKILVFSSGIEHAHHISDVFSEHNINAPVVHSKIKKSERDERIEKFYKAKQAVLINNGILTTGNDFPDLDLIAVMRPTESVSLWVQIAGRGTRPLYAEGFDLSTKEGRHAAMAASKKQNCLLLDFGRNTERLGPINDPIMPRRKGQRKSERKGIAPVKVCESCGTYNHASVRYCTSCQAEFKKEVKLAGQSGSEEIIRKEPVTPKIDTFSVDRVVYGVHRKKPHNSLKVTYHCGLRTFKEFVCLEHANSPFPLSKARTWWRKRTNIPVPDTIVKAMDFVDALAVPVEIDVWHNKRFPEIMSYNFSKVDSDE